MDTMGNHVKHVVKVRINIILCFVIIHTDSQHTIEYNEVAQALFVLRKFMLAAKNHLLILYVFGHSFKEEFSQWLKSG